MNYKTVIFALVFVLAAVACGSPAAETEDAAEVSPPAKETANPNENAAPDAAPDTKEEKEIPPGTVSDLENEMNILIKAGNIIGPEHYADIEDRVLALEGSITSEEIAGLKEKLSKLADLTPSGSSQPVDGSAPAPDPETGDNEPEATPVDYEPAGPDPAYDNFTWTLPVTASPVRLSLPTDVDNFLFSQDGGIGGYGLHAGGHIEGLDHVWIELKPGTPLKSWADGVVTDISYNGPPGEGEYHIKIDYGDNLIGIHMEVGESYFEVGDRVARGQEIGMGMSFVPTQSSGEMALIDLGRNDGVRVHGGGVYVSPFDYLQEPDKTDIINAYKTQVIEPYVNTGVKIWGFEPYQPYLTNSVFLHDDNEGRLPGVWYLTSSEWEIAYPNDQLTFIEADNPYFTGNVVLARDPGYLFSAEWHIKGTFEVDYATGRLIISRDYYPDLYGIFEIDESGDLAVLTIEYQEDYYPQAFSENALTYQQRD